MSITASRLSTHRRTWLRIALDDSVRAVPVTV